MKSFDYEAYTYGADIYCIECLPEGVDPNSDEVHPIFADSEWDYWPSCCNCGAVHDYVSLTPEGREYESEFCPHCHAALKEDKDPDGEEYVICTNPDCEYYEYLDR